ncbi:L-glyceraldehyde 3-phosphate reductase [Roseivivax jejudonensis]|uniref:L-glyceraldehyde 3-phosphate reductase n=1 Tax=Roseivivax jejudonensis TaxID=1529041 RepID=A0A1X6ZIE9_9RHOB|nr:aldo/keto reductase [Roseivivax jejudonensis]SLN52480.1 L-glyceraldehyde 3-phosphate reductase [Roseivivax jejudonensis]
MQYRPLGRTGLSVSELCLGTMTFGSQTDETVAHAQIDRALDAGVNFMDAAEMYPVNPVAKETIGRTEEILGTWFAQTGRRDDWIVATKVSGAGLQAVRDGAPISPRTMTEALEASLRRLRTDVIDLYQLHWPNRGSYAFRQNWSYAPWEQDRAATRQHMHDVLGWMGEQVARGTIRHFGLSNESAWGTTEWLRIARETGTPEVQSVQNEYSLLYRMADTDLAEVLVNEGVGLLPFSPLAAGLLSGKYQEGAVPAGSRMSINGDLGGRATARVFPAVDAYLEVARRFGIDPVHMAFAWSARRPFVASSIFGATTLEQLEHALGAADVEISDELAAALDAVWKVHPFPY